METNLYLFGKYKKNNLILNVNLNDTVDDLKIQIRELTNIPKEFQLLEIDRIILEDDRKLKQYGIIQSTIVKITDLRPKPKKKNFAELIIYWFNKIFRRNKKENKFL